MVDNQTSVDTSFMEEATEAARASRVFEHIKDVIEETIVEIKIAQKCCFFTTIDGDVYNLTLTKVDTEDDVLNT